MPQTLYFRNNMKTISVLFLSVFLFVACSQKDADDVIILVTPSAVTAESMSNVYFDIYARTIHDNVASIDVSSFDTTNGDQHLGTISADKKVFKERFPYRIPNITGDELKIDFTFRATDNLGNTMDCSVTIIAMGNTALLPENSGITLYSPHSGKNDALSLNPLRTLSSAIAEPKSVDIFIYTDEAMPKNAIGHEWRSMTGVRFVRFNDFDYASANKQSVKSAYDGAAKNDNVANLQIDDIILVGRDKTALGVIKVVGIFDDEGCDNDRYLINVKLLKAEDSESGNSENPEESDSEKSDKS